MTTIWPSIWSAVAATCSAIAALILMRVHLANREDSVRPEVILDGWSFQENPPAGWAIIRITKIRNEGKGPALHVRGKMEAHRPKVNPEQYPVASLNYSPVAILPAGSELLIAWEGWFNWERSSVGDPAAPMALLIITLFIHDVHGRLHELTYELVAAKDGQNVAGATNLIPGLDLSHRYSKRTSGWRLRLRGQWIRTAAAAAALRKRIEASRLGQTIRERLKEAGVLPSTPPDRPAI